MKNFWAQLTKQYSVETTAAFTFIGASGMPLPRLVPTYPLIRGALVRSNNLECVACRSTWAKKKPPPLRPGGGFRCYFKVNLG